MNFKGQLFNCLHTQYACSLVCFVLFVCLFVCLFVYLFLCLPWYSDEVGHESDKLCLSLMTENLTLYLGMVMFLYINLLLVLPHCKMVNNISWLQEKNNYYNSAWIILMRLYGNLSLSNWSWGITENLERLIAIVSWVTLEWISINLWQRTQCSISHNTSMTLQGTAL